MRQELPFVQTGFHCLKGREFKIYCIGKVLIERESGLKGTASLQLEFTAQIRDSQQVMLEKERVFRLLLLSDFLEKCGELGAFKSFGKRSRLKLLRELLQLGLQSNPLFFLFEIDVFFNDFLQYFLVNHRIVLLLFRFSPFLDGIYVD